MVHWVKELEIYSLFQMKTPSLNDESRTCSPLDWIHYRLYPVPVPFPLPSPTKYIYIYLTKPPDHSPAPSPCSAPTLKSGSQEMKGLGRVKLSSSPHRTFQVVIHSWQNPFTLWQPVFSLMYGAVSCHHPGHVHRGPHCFAPSFPPNSVLYIALTGCDVGLGWGFIPICDGSDTWQRKYADGVSSWKSV